MRSGLDTSLLPPDNELKKWSFNGYIKQLPWDSAIIARFTQSKLTNSFAHRIVEPQADAACPPPTGNPRARTISSRQSYDLVTQPGLVELQRQHQDDDGNVAWNASPMAQLDTRVYYDYYDLQNDSTERVVSGRAARARNCANRPVNSATCFRSAR